MRARALAVMSMAVVCYTLAAWSVLPGFYDGIAPPRPYRWLSPPPQAASDNQVPLAGHGSITVARDGRVNPGTVVTQDGQFSLAFDAGGFVTPTGGAPVSVGIVPQRSFPHPGRIILVTNVYCITSNSSLARGHDALVTMQYSSLLPAPSDVYESVDGGAWRKLANGDAAAPYFAAARATVLGCFAGGYVPGASTAGSAGSGGQLLPLVVGVAILVVVLAAVPLVVLRRRGWSELDDD